MPEDEDLLLITALEGQVDIKTLDPALQAEYTWYQKTLLKADTAIQYPNKEELKRKTGVIIPLWIQRSAAAAAIALLVWSIWPSQIDMQYQARIDEQALPQFESIELGKHLALEKQPIAEPSPLNDDMKFEKVIIEQEPNQALAQEETPLAIPDSSMDLKEQLPLTPIQPMLDNFVEMDNLDKLPILVDEPSLDLEITELPETHDVDTPITNDLSNTNKVLVQSRAEEYSTALDVIKRATRGSGVFALENAEPGGKYTESSLRVGSFKVSLKRRKRKS